MIEQHKPVEHIIMYYTPKGVINLLEAEAQKTAYLAPANPPLETKESK